VQAIFFGLGSDGTVGANKNSVKIVCRGTDLWTQGYFVYDSKKSGSLTVSHLRFGPRPIRSTYTIEEADFVACHQFGLLEKLRVLDSAKRGCTFLLNSPYPANEVWDRLPRETQEQLIEREAEFWVIDAYAIARELGLGNRINTIMQPCFFKLSGLLPEDEALQRVKESVEEAYGRRGPAIVEKNLAAIDRSLAGLQRVEVAAVATSERHIEQTIPEDAPEFVKQVTARLMAGDGDRLPVSLLPADGTFPPGTTKYEKRSIAKQIPIWDPEICIQCGKCAIACPHATIRMKAYPPEHLEGAPPGFKHKDFRAREAPGLQQTIQVAPDDCTGCGVCVDVCPAKSKVEVRHKAIDMLPADEHRLEERENWDFFSSIPRTPRDLLPHDSVRGAQLLEPLFEFSGACAGCGETPYLKLVSQLFGDRMVISDATGCSSIYSAALPTAAWTTDERGYGPAWNNPLFEDAAEFGLGLRLRYEAQRTLARRLVHRLAREIGEGLSRALLEAEQTSESQIGEQRERVARLLALLEPLAGDHPDATALAAVAGTLVRQSVWIVGGDGWAYDIGFGGLDHVLASGHDVNALVLDTEVYSNTGGQSSKATSRGAVAKFASLGKAIAKKDLGAIARAYGNVYVAQVAMGANDTQVAKAFLEADAWPGPSLIIAYSTCIAHGIDMSRSMTHQKDAVRSGYWPLYRYQPSESLEGQPFTLDSKKPTIQLREFVDTEARFAILLRSHPERAERLLALAQEDVDERWRYYEQLAAIERTVPGREGAGPEVESDAGYRYDEEGR
jgi:pyruvate-ferredoxin/flavodoxin oxidoreductase